MEGRARARARERERERRTNIAGMESAARGVCRRALSAVEPLLHLQLQLQPGISGAGAAAGLNRSFVLVARSHPSWIGPRPGAVLGIVREEVMFDGARNRSPQRSTSPQFGCIVFNSLSPCCCTVCRLGQGYGFAADPGSGGSVSQSLSQSAGPMRG